MKFHYSFIQFKSENVSFWMDLISKNGRQPIIQFLKTLITCAKIGKYSEWLRIYLHLAVCLICFSLLAKVFFYKFVNHNPCNHLIDDTIVSFKIFDCLKSNHFLLTMLRIVSVIGDFD